ncbi:MAG: AAA family ATPase [Deltaproteobacteria bacterium]|nr:MAG: AAA family ATPase [Deltaproteobacteria bacterium]
MYEKFFGLKEKPFSLTPDTEYFYRYCSHQEALNVLLVALRNGEGFVRVGGEVGTGKTLLCRQLLKLLQDDCATAYLPNTLLTPRELYQAISDDLQLESPENASIQQLNLGIFSELVRLRKLKRPLVVLIDEAQAMPHRILEALRLLSNLETEKEKLLHIFFFAQPEFEQRLLEDNLRQLRQRITFSYTLSTLDSGEVFAYLEHRLRIAEYEGESLFTPVAVKLLHKAAKGVPRLINLLAHKALLIAYGKGVRKIDKKMILSAIEDTHGLTLPRRNLFSTYAVEFGMIMVIVVATLYLWGEIR